MRLRDPDREREATRRWRENNPVRSLWAQIKGNAKTRGRELGITYEDLLHLLEPMTCAVTGHHLSWLWDGEGDNPWAPSLDRIDCSKGYLKGNVRVVCWAYNVARRNWPDAVVREMAEHLMRE